MHSSDGTLPARLPDMLLCAYLPHLMTVTMSFLPFASSRCIPRTVVARHHLR